ncbi:MAG: ATP-dependent protease ATPase subunit HslU [Oscillospiraceae bacterium]|jgi:ATP-dependent HslUV protease ATP-binding subunit HslU|nr:ATP-dependent protease ATPase subunit HslU [Oscillospiraceae bacterium]
MAQLTPREIVRELDRYIIGQSDAKRAVAVALRNRYRRAQLPDEMRDEISPKNILMIGPTGVGKTEIARRLAKLVDAPFIKVEATKFTEVGYVGRDVDSIVRDLVEASIRMVKEQHGSRVRLRAQVLAEERIAELLSNPLVRKQSKPLNPIDILLGNKPKEPDVSPEETQRLQLRKEDIRQKLLKREMEEQEIEVEVEESAPNVEIQGTAVNIGDMMGGLLPKRMKTRRVRVSEARRLLMVEEEGKLIDMDAVTQEAIRRAEQDGIVFIDEIDKIAGRNSTGGPDVSREGVQRDILPIVEGSTINTKYGPVKTDYMLFIAAGAFHVAKVKDLIPELQGRFPVRVTLKSLTREDFRNILFQPENALTRQYTALLSVDHVRLTFEDSALDALAEAAYIANENGEDIGARRLSTLFEKLLEDISFNAGSDMPDVDLAISSEYVKSHLDSDAKERDLRQFIV